MIKRRLQLKPPTPRSFINIININAEQVSERKSNNSNISIFPT